MISSWAGWCQPVSGDFSALKPKYLGIQVAVTLPIPHPWLKMYIPWGSWSRFQIFSQLSLRHCDKLERIVSLSGDFKEIRPEVFKGKQLKAFWYIHIRSFRVPPSWKVFLFPEVFSSQNLLLQRTLYLTSVNIVVQVNYKLFCFFCLISFLLSMLDLGFDLIEWYNWEKYFRDLRKHTHSEMKNWD